ncbi:hypothetical protein TCON_2776, partial [Astathelohania contejeani]
KLKTEISQIMDLEINQITNLVDVLSKIYEKVEMFLKLILELKKKVNIDSIEKIEARTANLHEKTLSLLKEFKCILEFDRKKIYMIKHSQTKWELKEIIEPLLKKRKSSDHIEKDYRLIKETLRDLKILIKKLKRDTIQLDEKIFERKIKIDDNSYEVKIRNIISIFADTNDDIAKCAANIETIYNKLKGMNIDEQRENNFKNSVVCAINKFENYYKELENLFYVFNYYIAIINSGAVYSKENKDYIDKYLIIFHDLYKKYIEINERIIPKLYTIYKIDIVMEYLDSLLREAKEEFDFYKNDFETDSTITLEIENIKYLNDRLCNLEKSIKNFPKIEVYREQFKHLFELLIIKIEKFDLIVKNYLEASDISYANYLKSIAEEITLKDDRLDEYHKKCVNELNIIKEDFN